MADYAWSLLLDRDGELMRTITAIVAKDLGKFIAKDFRRLFGSGQQDIAERLNSLAQSTMECVGRSDALPQSRTYDACDYGWPRHPTTENDV